jgi:hypothetical protein
MRGIDKQRSDNNNVMMMSSYQHANAERLQAPYHPSEATINLECTQFREKEKRERDNFEGWDDRKESRWKKFGGDHFISTQLIPNQNSSHPRAASAQEPILHVFWVNGCTIGVFNDGEKKE